MQFVEGVSLRSAIPREGVDLRRAANIVHQLGQALSAAHDKGIYHRDLKPENVMLQRFGGEEIVRLIDFGIATVRDSNVAARRDTTVVAGTLHYMAPEQFLGRPTHKSDIYALGVIAYELVTGRAPFNSKSAMQLQQEQQHGPRVHPKALRHELSDRAEELILRALSNAPAKRPDEARVFGQELASALQMDEDVAVYAERPSAVTDQRLPASQSCTIFLQYGSLDATSGARVYNRLCSRFPGQVFRDIDGDGPDSNSDEVKQALSSCKVLVLVVGKEWGSQLSDSESFVRKEISTVLNDAKPVFFAVLAGGRVPGRESLPPELTNLIDRQAFPITEHDFNRDVERLSEVISRELTATHPVLPREESLKVLLSEFRREGPGRRVSRRFMAPLGLSNVGLGALTGARLATGFFLVALIATYLAVDSHASLLSVTLVGTKGDRLGIRMGYLYELNAGPMYLTLVPLFVLMAFRFLGSIQSALRSFESDRRLRYNRHPNVQGSATRRSASPLMEIAAWNRRLFRWLLPAILVITFWSIVWGEIGPFGAYQGAAFGYVQAPHFPTYKVGGTLAEFERTTGRVVHEIGGVQEKELSNYVIERIEGGPRSRGERAGFFVFLGLHLFLEWFFACLVAWFLLKVLFVLWLVLWSIRPNPRHPIELELDLLDPDYCYGLAWLNRAWKYLLKSLLIGVLIGICQQLTNASKGSWTALNFSVPASDWVGHTAVGYFGLTFAVLFVCYMVLLSSKVESLKDDAVGSHSMVIKQNFPGDRSLTFLTVASPLCYGLLLLMSNVWTTIASHWDGIASRLIG
jgi:hypothetical protein